MPPVFKGEAVQVVSLQGHKNDRKLRLHTKVLRSIADEARGIDIATIAIAGPARGGKSFILTYIIRYLKALEKAKNGEVGDWMEKNDPDKSMHGQGFSFRNGTERTTDGIWMWSRPFIVQPSPNRPPIAVVVIDTEGCFDSTASEKDQSSIIGLSLLASSCFIFNESTKINENTLMTLAKFMQYGQLATQSFDDKSFQQLMFLVRDWNMPSTHPYGAAGGQQFIRASMIPKADMSSEAVECRNAILKSFEQQDAYLMPHPGDAVIADEFTGSIGEMNDSFKNHIELFVVGLVADVDTKKVSNTIINGTSFYSLFESYLAAFNSDEMPSPASILKANLLVAFESILQKQVSIYQAKFEEKLNKSELPFQPLDTMQNWNDAIAKQIMQSFDQKANIGTPEEKVIFAKKLQNDLERSFYQLRKDNEEKQNTFIESSESKSLGKFKEYVERNILPADKFWTETEFENTVSKAEKSAQSKFLQACTGMPENFIKAQQILFNSKLDSIKSDYWNQLYDRRMIAEDELSNILQEIEADYDDMMTEATRETIVTASFLDNLHKRQLAGAKNKFERKVKDITDMNFLQIFFDDLMSRLNSKYQAMKIENQSRIDAFVAQIDKDIEDAVCLLREELERLIPDSHPSDFTAFDQVYDEFLAIGSEQLEELAAIGRRTHLEYQKKLDKCLKEVLVEAKEAVKNSRTARQERCQQFIQSAVNEFILQLDQITKNQALVSTAELISAINSIDDTIRSSLQSKILAEDPDGFSNFLSEYQQLTEVMQQKVQLDNVERLKRFEDEALDLSVNFADDYIKFMDKQADECTSIEELSQKHSQIVANLTNSYSTDLRNKYHNDKLTAPCVERLTAELEREFENVRQQFENKIQREHELKREVLDETVHNFEQSMKSRIDENPFISKKKFESALDDAEEKCTSEFKRNSSFNSSGDKIKKDLLKKLSAKINAVREELEDYKRKSIRAAQTNIDDLIDSTSVEAEEQIKQKFESYTSPDTSLLQMLVTSIKEEIKAYFEKSWTIDDEDQKEEAWAEVEKRVNPSIRSATEALEERIKQQKRQAMMASDDVILNSVQTIEQVLAQGKAFPPELLHAKIDEVSSKAITDYELFCANNSYVPSAEERQMKSDKIRELGQKMRQQNDQNQERILQEIAELCKQEFNRGKSGCNNEDSLRQLRADIVKKCQSQLRNYCTEDPSKYQALVEKIHSICNSMYENISRDKRESVNPGLTLQEAVRNYIAQMDDKVKGLTSIDASKLANYHRAVVNKIFKDLHAKGFIPQDLEQAIDARLQKSLQIYDNKLLLKNTQRNVAVGIDLGTTTSCVAIHRGDNVEVIRDNSGKALIPSYVCFQSDGGTKVGKAAKDESHLNPENTIFDSKRLIGREFTDEKVQEDMKTWPFKIVNRNGKPKIVAHDKEYDPEDISAHILKHMKKLASDKLGVDVKQAVITVPANFTDRQRDATRQAAQIAGLEVLQIINEPTAAAMAYTLNTSHEDKNVLVYDFGGGTFDVTILKASAADLEVLTTMGDTHLGGEDFDHNMVLHCAKKFEEQHGIKLLEVEEKDNAQSEHAAKRRIRRLRNICEDAKASLSVASSATINADAIYKAMDLSITIQKTEFEAMNMKLFQKSIDIVAEAITKVHLRPGDIHEVLMVGGSARIPKIKDMLEQYLGMRNLVINDEVDIQEAVARGAATQACIMSGGSSALRLIKDVTPFSLGIKTVTGEMSVIIAKDTTIPAEAVEIYTTSVDNQTEVKIEIFSGEDPVATNNKSLGNFTLDGIPPERKGAQKLDVKMKIDSSGILEVTAFCLSTGGTKNLVIKEGRGRLSDDEVARKRRELGC